MINTEGTQMQFRDLKTQYLSNQKKIDLAVQSVLLNSQFIGGEPVRCLEEELADYVGVRHCITCANGTDALTLALMTWGVGEGDAVFVPDFTFFASGEAPASCGATPIFVDVDRDTFNILPQKLESAIQKVLSEGKLHPKVVITVDLFGQPADYEAVKNISERYDLLILEDGAQGFGGSLNKQKNCSFGDISITSFFPAKPLGCYGDGGALFTDNDEWAEIIGSLCVHGKGKDRYDNIRIGMNSRLDTLQAAVLRAKLEIFQNFELEQINQVAEWYSEELGSVVHVPVVLKNGYSSWAQYTVVCKDADERKNVRESLKREGIPSMIYYPKGLHAQTAFAGNYKDLEDYTNTTYLSDRVLSLPVHPYLKQSEVEFISKTITQSIIHKL